MKFLQAITFFNLQSIKVQSHIYKKEDTVHVMGSKAQQPMIQGENH